MSLLLMSIILSIDPIHWVSANSCLSVHDIILSRQGFLHV